MRTKLLKLYRQAIFPLFVLGFALIGVSLVLAYGYTEGMRRFEEIV